MPIDEQAVNCAYVPRKWTGRCSNPRLLVFSQVLNRLSYQSNKAGKR